MPSNSIIKLDKFDSKGHFEIYKNEFHKCSPLISVVMSVYNGEKYLSQSIESILTQTVKEYEFIIINDGSTDNSLDILFRFQKQDSRIIIVNQENLGLTKSLNRGFELSKGKYIARQDADDISLPERFSKQIVYFSRNQTIGVLGTNVYRIKDDSSIIGLDKMKSNYKDIKNTLKIRNALSHGSVMLNKDMLGTEIFYNEYFKYSQDYELWSRISKKVEIYNLKDFLYMFREHNDSISTQKFFPQLLFTALVIYKNKYSKDARLPKQNATELTPQEVTSCDARFKKILAMQLLLTDNTQLITKFYFKYHWFNIIAFLDKKIHFINKLKKINIFLKKLK